MKDCVNKAIDINIFPHSFRILQLKLKTVSIQMELKGFRSNPFLILVELS
jgi:hypothetical protein